MRGPRWLQQMREYYKARGKSVEGSIFEELGPLAEQATFTVGQRVMTPDGPGVVKDVFDNFGEIIVDVELTGPGTFPGPFEFFPRDLRAA